MSNSDHQTHDTQPNSTTRPALVLTTARVMLRQFTVADGGLLFALHNDPAVMRFLTGGRAIPRAVIEQETLPHILEYYVQFPGFGTWAAYDHTTQTFLGWFSFGPHAGEPTNIAELGYRLHQAAWGHGYATEVGRALLARGFTTLGVERVIAQTMTVNRASRHVMEKLGLGFVRTFFAEWPDQIEGGEQGDVEYALTKAEWLHQQPA